MTALPGTTLEAYLDWDREMRQLAPTSGANEGDWFSPTLVELHPTADAGAATYKNTKEKLIEWADNDEATDRLLIDNVERLSLDFLVGIEAVNDTASLGEVRAIVLRLEGSNAHVAAEDGSTDPTEQLFTEIHRGPAIFVTHQELKEHRNFSLRSSGDSSTPRTIATIGVIDDGIPYLNREFVGSDRKSRISAVWLQSFETLKTTSANNSVFNGQIFENSEIEQYLNRDERSVYREVGDNIYKLTDVKSSTHAVSHGAHVMSIACGRSHGIEPGSEDQIFAVQLPPESVLDTSGKRLDFTILQGVRWIALRTLLAAVGTPGSILAPLVINVSFGMGAGPKDGTGFLEEALREEVRRYQLWTDKMIPGVRPSPMRVVLPYGNAFRDNLVATQELQTGGSVELDWRIQPDDRTASYLEIRAEASAHPKLFLTPPGHETAIAFDLSSPKTIEEYCRDGTTLARVYRVADDLGGRATFLVALRPTHFSEYQAVPAPAGNWKLKVSTSGRSLVSIQVQRDDTPFNFRPNGRQSYLDAQRAHGFDPELRNYSLPMPGCAISRKGTHSATVSQKSRPGLAPTIEPGDRGIYAVGGTYARHIDDNCLPMSRYSASGSEHPDWSNSPAPTLSAPCEESHGLPGMLASGVVSGSTAILGGTSVAAPQVARRLLTQLKNGSTLASLEAEADSLLPSGKQCRTEPERRGRGLTEPAGTNRR
ncbi:MAG: hypothetical protein AAF468_17015 [Pseudomonadota bacterium]